MSAASTSALLTGHNSFHGMRFRQFRVYREIRTRQCPITLEPPQFLFHGDSDPEGTKLASSSRWASGCATVPSVTGSPRGTRAGRPHACGVRGRGVGNIYSALRLCLSDPYTLQCIGMKLYMFYFATPWLRTRQLYVTEDMRPARVSARCICLSAISCSKRTRIDPVKEPSHTEGRKSLWNSRALVWHISPAHHSETQDQVAGGSRRTNLLQLQLQVIQVTTATLSVLWLRLQWYACVAANLIWR